MNRTVVKRWWPRLLALLLAATAAGCMLVDEERVQKDDNDRVPWNTPSGWENQGVGIPH